MLSSRHLLLGAAVLLLLAVEAFGEEERQPAAISKAGKTKVTKRQRPSQGGDYTEYDGNNYNEEEGDYEEYEREENESNRGEFLFCIRFWSLFNFILSHT